MKRYYLLLLLTAFTISLLTEAFVKAEDNIDIIIAPIEKTKPRKPSPSLTQDQQNYLKLMNQNFAVFNELYEELKNNQRKIVGVEIIIAEGTSASLVSRFGHASLRFIDDNDDFLDDIVIGFEMPLLNEGISTILNAVIFGGYEAVPFVNRLSERIHFYMDGEQRGIYRYPLVLSSQELGTLLTNLKNGTLATDIAGDYLFASNNCLTALLTYLDHLGISFPIDDRFLKIDVPDEMGARVQANFMMSVPELKMESAGSIQNEVERQFPLWKIYGDCHKKIPGHPELNPYLYVKGKMILPEDVFNEYMLKDDFLTYLKTCHTPFDVAKLYSFLPNDWSKKSLRIKSHLGKLLRTFSESERQNLSVKNLMKLTDLPKLLYLPCRILGVENQECYEQKVNALIEMKIFDQSDLLHLYKSNVENYLKKWKRKKSTGLKINQPLVNYLCSEKVLDVVTLSAEFLKNNQYAESINDFALAKKECSFLADKNPN